MKTFMGKVVHEDGLIGDYNEDKNDYLDVTNKNFAFGRTVFTKGIVVPWMRMIVDIHIDDKLPEWDKNNKKWQN